MKRMKKALIGLAVGAVAALGVVGLAACGGNTTTLEGEYHYANPWSTEDAPKPDYGVKVEVTVNKDDNTIEKVEIVESDYVQCTESWTDKNTYLNGEAELLAAYEGLEVDDVLAMTVTTGTDGTPSAVSESDLLITGATQSSGRLLKAVQDALADYESAE